MSKVEKVEGEISCNCRIKEGDGHQYPCKANGDKGDPTSGV